MPDAAEELEEAQQLEQREVVDLGVFSALATVSLLPWESWMNHFHEGFGSCDTEGAPFDARVSNLTVATLDASRVYACMHACM